jgi:hypothetical protein
MHEALQALLWFVLALGALTLISGVLTLATRRAAYPWLRGRVAWKRWGWAQVMTGLGVVLAEAPWLAGDTTGPIFAVAMAGAVLLAVGSTLQLRVQLPRA